jgi:hypothetical protein
MIQFFPSFNLGDAGVVAMLAVMWWRLGSLEKKVERAAPRDLAEAQHDSLQTQINGIHKRMDLAN